MFIIASRKEAGYWSVDGWSYGLSNAMVLADEGDGQLWLSANSEAEPELWPMEVALEFGDFNPELEHLYRLQPGDEVTWTDPDAGFSTGIYRILQIMTESGRVESAHGNTMLLLRNESGSEVEALLHELA